MKKCIINGKVILHDEIVNKNVFIENDKIVEISNRQATDEDIIDAKGQVCSTWIYRCAYTWSWW